MTTGHPLTSYDDDFGQVITEVAYVGNHPEDVLYWRLIRFQELGFSPEIAENLAEGKIDLHHMEDLLTKGCPLDLALGILSGTSWYGDDEGQPTSDPSQALLSAPVASGRPSRGGRGKGKTGVTSA